ncbi:MAG: uridine kinase [Clostridia bacterium]|nr:uridine kinase [Clostridia bacterium]
MKKPFVIGVAGGSGSGKSTLVKNIIDTLGGGVAILRQDDYYKPMTHLSPEERARVNYDRPDAFDTGLLIFHLDKLISGVAVEAPIYDYETHERVSEVRRVTPAEVIILDGILILENRELRERLDLKVFVDTDADVRILRRIVRDVSGRGRSLESVIEQYLSTVKPMHEAFVEPTRRYADLVIPEGGGNPVAYGMIVEKIEKYINSES